METWNRLLQSLGDVVPRLRLRTPVDPTGITRAEAGFGFELPSDYRAWLQMANGQEPGGLSIFPLCAWFASLDHVIAQWQYERELIAKTQNRDRAPCVLGCAPDDPRVRCGLWHPRRIAIAISEQHETLCGVEL